MKCEWSYTAVRKDRLQKKKKGLCKPSLQPNAAVVVVVVVAVHVRKQIKTKSQN